MDKHRTRYSMVKNEPLLKRNKSQSDTQETDKTTSESIQLLKQFTEEQKKQEEKKQRYKELRMKANQVTSPKKPTDNNDNQKNGNEINHIHGKSETEKEKTDISKTKTNGTSTTKASRNANSQIANKNNVNNNNKSNKNGTTEVAKQNKPADSKKTNDNNAKKPNDNNAKKTNDNNAKNKNHARSHTSSNSTENNKSSNDDKNKENAKNASNIKPSNAQKYSSSKKQSDSKNDENKNKSNENKSNENKNKISNNKSSATLSKTNASTNTKNDDSKVEKNALGTNSTHLKTSTNDNLNNTGSGSLTTTPRSDFAVKSKFRPFYLQRPTSTGGTNETSQRIGPNGLRERTWHEKKRDARVNEQFRKAESVESDYINNFKEYSYVYYHNLQNIKKASNNDEKVDTRIPNDVKSIEVDFGDINVDICQEMLITQDESWEGRMEICHELISQINDLSVPFEIYYLKMAKFLYGIYYQYADNRSLVLEEMNKMFSKFCKETAERFIVFAPYLFKATFIAIPIRIEVLRDAAIQFAENVVTECNKYDTNHKLLDAVIEGLDFQHALTRCVCADLFEYMLRSIPLLEKSDSTEEEKNLLEKIDVAVKKAVGDASSEARTNGYRALHTYHKISPSRAKKIVEGFSRAVKRKFDVVTNRPNST